MSYHVFRKPSTWPRWIWASVAFAILILPAAITVGFFDRVRDVNCGILPPIDTQRTINLQMDLISVDPLNAVTVLEWLVGGDTCGCNSDCPAVNIFFDVNLLTGAAPKSDPPSNNLLTNPTFVFNRTAACSVGDGAAPLFVTSVYLSFDITKGNREFSSKTSLEDYPFDEYFALAAFYARDNSTGQMVNVNVTPTRGVAVGYRVKSCVYFPSGSYQGGPPALLFSFKRAPLVIAYDIVIVIGQWFITLVLSTVMIKSVLFRYRQSASLLVVPVTTLFTFTQLRATMPGAPTTFGAIIDFASVLPCLAILVMASTLTLLIFLVRDPEKRRVNTSPEDQEQDAAIGGARNDVFGHQSSLST
ncbi:hypothetical protein BD410DRAFT_794837 [Rickenella mellea]|uniref:Uncharacterized protein n=1 Tax=Rickenella mellea TaxID=50990 RepID=A0A4Y7PP07_9AGAM|nr:hypothetical protein BD410DRAFT_794837 [Rickenella mellea]